MGLDGSLTINGNAQNVLDVKVSARSLVLDGDLTIMGMKKSGTGRLWRSGTGCTRSYEANDQNSNDSVLEKVYLSGQMFASPFAVTLATSTWLNCIPLTSRIVCPT